MALLSERDARAWHGLAGQIALELEPRLRPSVMANRTFVSPDGVRRVPLLAELPRARRAASSLAARHPVVIRTDVRSFYPSVTPSTMFASLRGLSVERRTARHVAGMLEGWGSEGYAGLPIGPPGSAVLANVVLAQVDDQLEGWPALRWVDDYLVGIEDDRLVPRVLERLDQALARQGLERSVSKTSILEGRRGFVWPGTYDRP
jgi:hypothetical protein